MDWNALMTLSCQCSMRRCVSAAPGKSPAVACAVAWISRSVLRKGCVLTRTAMGSVHMRTCDTIEG